MTTSEGQPPLIVVLCSFNGARFLQQQLSSIAAQTLQPQHMLVVDDTSTDRTLEMLRDFAAHSPMSVTLRVNEKRLGVVRNFEKALALADKELEVAASSSCDASGWVALADQDDVWRKDKLATLLAAARRAEAMHGSSTPMLVHSDLTLIDEAGRVLHPSHFQLRGHRRVHASPLLELPLQNYVTGCATLVNRALLALALPFPTAVPMHDWWLALVAAAGGVVLTLDAQTVLYRQHGANIIGSQRPLSLLDPRQWRAGERRYRERITLLDALRTRLDERGLDSKAVVRIRRLMQPRGLADRLALLGSGLRAQRPAATLAMYVYAMAAHSKVEASSASGAADD